MKMTHGCTCLIVVLFGLAARAEETQVIFDGTSVAAWDRMRSPERLAREFTVDEVSAVNTPPSLSWRFVSTLR